MNSIVHIEKTLHGIPIRNIWHMMLYACDAPDAIEFGYSLVEDAPSIDGLFASALVSLMNRRLRRGIGRSFADSSREISGLRGRVLIAESQRRLLFERGRAHCRFPEFVSDVPRNRMIKAVLSRLIASGDFGANKLKAIRLRQECRQTVRALADVRNDLPHITDLDRDRLGRGDGDYRLMLSICRLILRRAMPTEADGASSERSLKTPRDETHLHDLYEKFVALFYRRSLIGWNTVAQMGLAWNSSATSAFLPGMRPDLILQNRATGQIIILDTKFTAKSLDEGRWGGQLKFNSSHLYQIYAYVRSQEFRSGQHLAAAGLLLYPTVRQALSETVAIDGHVIRVCAVDLAKKWNEIESDLIEIIEITSATYRERSDPVRLRASNTALPAFAHVPPM